MLLAIAATLFGGASQTNALSLMAVELCSVPLLFSSLYLVLAGAAPPGSRFPLLLLVLVAAVPSLELIRLPYSVWSHLPGHAPVQAVAQVASLGQISFPYTLAPEDAWRYALALAPPTAMFAGVLFLSDGQKRVLCIVWMSLAMLSVAIGAMQLVSGQSSRLYFYPITNGGSAVGLFSNRNHQAALLFCLLPISGIFLSDVRRRLRERDLFAGFLPVLFVFVSVAGIGATDSRAGIILGGAALVGLGVVILQRGTLKRQWRPVAAVGAGSAVAIAAVVLLSLNQILERIGAAEPRFQEWPILLKAAAQYLPFGAGVGSFEPVYLAVEPLADVSPIYFNHAHNEYIELWLETGYIGAALFALFVAWFVNRCLAVWLTPIRSGSRDLAAACTVAVLLLLVHSLVDYPLRTESLAVLFAFACGTLASYSPKPTDGEETRSSGTRKRRRRVRLPAVSPGR